MIHSSKEKRLRNEDLKFSQQEVDITKSFLYVPEGMENIFVGLYFIFLPFIAGVLFQYFYISDGKIEIFLSIYEKSMGILIWSIGYEILAAASLLYIIKLSLSFSTGKKKRSFVRP